MTSTINSYSTAQGELEVTLSAGNVSAIAAFTTAESIVIDGVLRSFRRTNNPERPVSETRVTGSDTPITIAGRIIPREMWELVLVDDYFLGAAGEWGTDDLSAVEIFRELFIAREQPGGLKCTPAGGASANIEITLTDPEIVAVGLPEIDADSEDQVATVTIMISASGHTTAAHG